MFPETGALQQVTDARDGMSSPRDLGLAVFLACEAPRGFGEQMGCTTTLFDTHKLYYWARAMLQDWRSKVT